MWRERPVDIGFGEVKFFALDRMVHLKILGSLFSGDKMTEVGQKPFVSYVNAFRYLVDVVEGACRVGMAIGTLEGGLSDFVFRSHTSSRLPLDLLYWNLTEDGDSIWGPIAVTLVSMIPKPHQLAFDGIEVWRVEQCPSGSYGNLRFVEA